MKQSSKNLVRLLINVILIQAGAVLAALGLEEFLVPNKIMDGGVVGISIITSVVWSIPLGALIFILNIPFMILSLKQLGWRFLLLTLYGVGSLSLWVTAFHHLPPVTGDLFLSTIFGGMILGAGVGLIIRNGGCLDGTEIIAIILNGKLPFSVGEIVMFFNIFIFGTAAFVFGIDRAMYSVVAYLIAYKAIDLMVEGIDESKSLFIVSDKSEEVAEVLMKSFKHGVTLLDGRGGYSKAEKNIVYVIVKRLEINKVKEAVKGIDENAFITIYDVHEVIGKNVKRWNS